MMKGIANNPFIPFDPIVFSGEVYGLKEVNAEDPDAQQAARPLFNSGVRSLAIQSQKCDYTFPLDQSGHLLILHLRGSMQAVFSEDSEAVNMMPGSLSLFPSGVKRQMSIQREEPAQWLAIHIDDVEFWTPLNKRAFFDPAYSDASLVYLLSMRILQAYSERGIRQLAASRTEALMLLTVLKRLRLQGPKEISPNASRLGKLVTNISSHPEEQWTQKRMVEETNMSASTLLRLCKEIYGKSPNALLAEMRMGQARQRLVNTDMSLEEISLSVGYHSVYTFSRIFKQHTGAPPIRYRKSRRQEQSTH